MRTRWTDQYKGSWKMLTDLLPAFLEAQETKKGLKDVFYPEVKDKFKAMYPQSVVPSEADIQKYGEEKAVQVLDKKLLQRICCWFPNNTCPGSKACIAAGLAAPPTASQKPDKQSQTRNESAKSLARPRRMLQPVQAYQVLFYKDAVKDDHEAAREAYVAQCKKDQTTPIRLFAFEP
ncbi:hypothetical protein BKA70DRAFT_1234008, partial [Coprinopsis sp. MPI-PUGE-AT-0042]